MDYYRQGENNSATRENLFAGATKQYGSGYGQQVGYQYPPPGGQYPPPGGQYPPPGGYDGNGGYDSYGQQQQETEDIEKTKSQIRATKLDSLGSTQRSLQMINDAESTAQSTLNKLGEQTQRINYADRQTDLAEAHADRAAEQASKLKKINGSTIGFDVSNPFTKKKRKAAELARAQAIHEQERDSRMHMRSGNYESQKRINEPLKQSDKHSHGSPKPPSSNSSSRNKFQFEADDDDNQIEDQLDKNVDMLSNGLTQLNHMANAAGEEVRRQNDTLDSLNDKTVGLDNRTFGTTHALKKV
ncbi:t-SNARE component Sec9 [Gigaspora margarita]|uniref:t-SNARE component Sec9 n=1 Tax=Gigaspora margarita TaxID=4874 RepID=A0A8H4AK06_GIGMA|nr:t-SNARE component Sec9 [Gigaspora margarita]